MQSARGARPSGELIAVAAGACLIFAASAYCVWHVVAEPTPQVLTTKARAAPVRVLDEPVPRKEPAANPERPPPKAVATARISVMGVAAHPSNVHSGLAIVQVGDDPPKVFKPGDRLDAATTLTEVHDSFVVIDESGVQRRLDANPADAHNAATSTPAGAEQGETTSQLAAQQARFSNAMPALPPLTTNGNEAFRKALLGSSEGRQPVPGNQQ